MRRTAKRYIKKFANWRCNIMIGISFDNDDTVSPVILNHFKDNRKELGEK